MEKIENLTKDWPGGYYLVLISKPMVPGYRPLIAIGYKYNARKVLYFIVTENSGSTKTDIQYLSKYPDQFTNVTICPVARPLVMLKTYAVNEVDSHKKSRQSDLALEKWWVNKCGCLQLCKTVAIGMTINNCWKLFRYEVNRDHYDKLIGIREFSERLDQDFYNKSFSLDRGTPAKNIPPLDEVDDGDTVSTCRELHFSSCIYPSAAVSTISDMALNRASTISIGSEHIAKK